MGDNGTQRAIRTDPERIRQLGIALHLSIRELCWFLCLTEVAYHRWFRNETEAFVSGGAVLLDLAERGITSGRLQRERLHRYLGLRRDQRGAIYRPASEPRTDDRRVKSWVYVARCAFTETELLQVSHPGLMESKRAPVQAAGGGDV